MPVALTTLPSRARSSSTNLAKLARVPPMGSMPMPFRRSTVAGAFMAASTAAAILSRIASGVPRGACTPAQWAMRISGKPSSAAVGSSG